MMKHFVLALLAIPLITSCSQEDTWTGVHTDIDVEQPVGTITDFKVGDREFGFTVSTERGPRFVTTTRRGHRMTSAIEASDGRLLFEIAVEFDGRSMIVCERTETDRLWMRHALGTREVREHFNLNGRELIVAYPRMDQVAMSKSFSLYQRGEYERVHPELLKAFMAFEKFYRTDNTVHWNADGETLVATLLSQELSAELSAAAAAKSANDEVIEAAGERKEFSLWCASVGVGTGLKCLFGGPANVICLFGTAHSIACGIFELACVLWPC